MPKLPQGAIALPPGASAVGDAPDAAVVGTNPAGQNIYGSPDAPSMASTFWRVLTNPVGEGQATAGSFGGDIRQAGGQAINTLAQPIAHPIDTAEGIGTSLIHPLDTLNAAIDQYKQQYAENPALANDNAMGQVLGGIEGGRMIGGALKPVARGVSKLASGEPDAAALKALRVGPSNKQGVRALQSLQVTRPMVAGARNLEDLQTRVAAAKNAVWKPYADAVAKVGKNVVQGPDGPTTVTQLEEDRQQVSALVRGIKTGNPEALQLAQQKGLTAAQLLEREKTIHGALDPELEKAGIAPKDLRKLFAQVSDVHRRIAGRTTVGEEPKSYGLGKVNVMKPSTIPAGLRDILARRPLFSGKPTDIAVREGFR